MEDGLDGLDPAEIHDVPTLAKYLTKLWIRKGKPSYREVEKHHEAKGGRLPNTELSFVPIRRTTLSEVLHGKLFPTKAFYLTFVAYCGVDLAADRRWERAWERVALNDDESQPYSEVGTEITVEKHPTLERSTSPGPTTGGESSGTTNVVFVSCDIVGHSASDFDTQRRNVKEVNRIVSDIIETFGPSIATWASGGDGGHVVLAGERWLEPALRLFADLQTWANKENVPLRITAHYGPVAGISGADKRTQFVGDGINMAGWILSKGSPYGIIVSDAFKVHCEGMLATTDFVFHEKRSLQHKSLASQDLWLLSRGQTASHWGLPADGDRTHLAEALERTDNWAVIYYAKRILQINPNDKHAIDAILQLDPASLRFNSSRDNKSVVNPFFGPLQPVMLREVVQLGELIERDTNEIICRYGDQGETMFVILRGHVGVYRSEGEGSSNPEEPGFVMSEGEVVGELAFVLGQTRTADLVTLTKTALLSFNMNEIFRRLPRDGQTRMRITEFINSRALEHISDHTSYLLGNDHKGPLAAGHNLWRGALSTLESGSRLLTVDPTDLQLSFDRVKSATPADQINPRNLGGGLYVLASGELAGVNFDAELQGIKFPILWVDIPGVLEQTTHHYTIIDGPVKILHINAQALGRLEPAKRAALYDALRRVQPTPQT